MSFKSIFAKASLVATTTFGSVAQAKNLSPETTDFLNQGQHAQWTERIKLEPSRNSYRTQEIATIKEDSFQNTDINQTYDRFGNTPLGLAVLNGKAEIVTDLIRQGANVNHPNRRGKRPLTEALMFRPNNLTKDQAEEKYKIIETLCKAGADVNFKDTDGETPLQVAANHLNGRAMTILKSYGADTQVRNENGKTPDQVYQERLGNLAQKTISKVK